MNITSQYNGCAGWSAPRLRYRHSRRIRRPKPSRTAKRAAPAGPEFKYQTGNIVLPNKVATLHLGERYRYLDPNETNKLLMAWGNEPDTTTQGAIIPADVDPWSEAGWAVILTYDDDGHVDDSDAAEIDYDDMLKDMKEGTEDHNDARKKAGFEAVHLIGWAEKPHYDAVCQETLLGEGAQFRRQLGDTRSTTTCACSGVKACCR